TATLSRQHPAAGAWQPPIVKTIATSGEGVAELVETIGRFRAHGASAQAGRRRARSAYRLRELVADLFMQRLERNVLHAGELEAIVDRIAARDLDPYTAADRLLKRAIESQPK